MVKDLRSPGEIVPGGAPPAALVDRTKGLRDKTQGPHGLREKKGPDGLIGPGALSFGTTGKHGGGYPGDMPWDFMHPLVNTGRLSPRTERVKSLNKSMRGFLTELDNEYRHKQKQWGESK